MLIYADVLLEKKLFSSFSPSPAPLRNELGKGCALCFVFLFFFFLPWPPLI